jgi:DNA repair protein RadA/Sms
VGLFLRLAKSTGVPIILVGHVTKSGDVAGPRTVEHMVDCVLYLEGGGLMGEDGGMSSLRVLRAAKNRFGSSEEVGVYQMDAGRDGRLVPVSDPSSFFLATREDATDVEGCSVSIVLEGVRSMAVEIQALVSFSAGSGAYSGRRVVDGISTSRLLLILAVLQKRYGISFHRQDVYVNVVGGLNLGKGSKSGSGSDLSVVLAVVSSLLGIPVRTDTAFVGEIGLLGELRPVFAIEKRISEARRMGFSRIITPSTAKKPGSQKVSGPREVSAGGITQIMCGNVLDALNCGLVKSLPTIATMSGLKLKRARRQNQNLDRELSDQYESLLDKQIILDDDEEDDFE